MKKRTLSTIISAAVLTVGIGVGAQALASEYTVSSITDFRASYAPEFSEVAPFMQEVFPDWTEEQLEEWYESRSSEVGVRGPGFMRGGFGPGFAQRVAPEFSEVAPFMQEVFPDWTEEQLEEWYESRSTEVGVRGPGFMRGGFGPNFNGDGDTNTRFGRGFGPRWSEDAPFQSGPRFGPRF